MAEDAERGRVYLPLEDLAAHNVTLESILHREQRRTAQPRTSAPCSPRLAARAEAYYASAGKLLPLIDRESRPALWVLVRIYRGLLKRIRRADYDVFSHRISVPTFQKLEILAVGMARLAIARFSPIKVSSIIVIIVHPGGPEFTGAPSETGHDGQSCERRICF